MHSPSVGSYGEGVSYERNTPVQGETCSLASSSRRLGRSESRLPYRGVVAPLPGGRDLLNLERAHASCARHHPRQPRMYTRFKLGRIEWACSLARSKGSVRIISECARIGREHKPRRKTVALPKRAHAWCDYRHTRMYTSFECMNCIWSKVRGLQASNQERATGRFQDPRTL